MKNDYKKIKCIACGNHVACYMDIRIIYSFPQFYPYERDAVEWKGIDDDSVRTLEPPSDYFKTQT